MISISRFLIVASRLVLSPHKKHCIASSPRSLKCFTSVMHSLRKQTLWPLTKLST